MHIHDLKIGPFFEKLFLTPVNSQSKNIFSEIIISENAKFPDEIIDFQYLSNITQATLIQTLTIYHCHI